MEAVGTPKTGHSDAEQSRARRKGREGCGQGQETVGLSANRNRECSLTDVGVAGDLAKDLSLSPCGFPHLLQLLRTQPLSCHLHDLHCKLIASGSMDVKADHRAHSSANDVLRVILLVKLLGSGPVGKLILWHHVQCSVILSEVRVCEEETEGSEGREAHRD